MEKSREIPPVALPPNAASKDAVERTKARVEALGVGWHDAVGRAKVSRNIGYKLLAGTASQGSLRKVEDWLVREEAKRGIGPRGADTKLDDWTQVGREFMRVDPRQFDHYLENLRMMVAAKIQEAKAKAQMFRPTPGDDE